MRPRARAAIARPKQAPIPEPANAIFTRPEYFGFGRMKPSNPPNPAPNAPSNTPWLIRKTEKALQACPDGNCTAPQEHGDGAAARVGRGSNSCGASSSAQGHARGPLDTRKLARQLRRENFPWRSPNFQRRQVALARAGADAKLAASVSARIVADWNVYLPLRRAG